MSETKHILGLSGGKDSAALAVHMNKKYPDLDIEYFITDTGYELKETYDFLNKLNDWGFKTNALNKLILKRKRSAPSDKDYSAAI